MEIIETGFRDLLIIRPKIYKDSRGYFFESYNQSVLKNEGIQFNPVQDNESSSGKGVIRGLHYQLNPVAQAKLIRVIEGRILDVVLDLRKGSPTFGKVFSTELDSENKVQLLIPRGFAHGFSVLSDIAVIQYKCDNVYSPQNERGISVNDPELGIDWKTSGHDQIISEKDSKHPSFMDAEYNFLF
jgi:dTDP-4-dehydrorhamnose 3,5-epimerase